MKRIIITLSICIFSFSFSQIKALTEDGREVVLLEDKTWRFVNESDQIILDEITTNNNVFEKSKDATFLLKSKIIDSGIYINPKKWKPVSKDIIPTAEYLFQNINNPQSLAVVISEKAPIPNLKSLKNIIISNIQTRVSFFRLLNSEYRTINGIKTLYLKYKANVKGLDFTYATVYYLTDEGYMSIMGYAYDKDFSSEEKEIDNFINGIVKTNKSQVEEVINTSPPPPMTKKK